MTVGEVRLTYRGSPSLASAFASMLEAEGLTVDWSPPFERKSIGQDAVAIVEMTVSGLAVTGLTAAVRTAIEKFRERFPRGGTVDESGDDEPAD